MGACPAGTTPSSQGAAGIEPAWEVIYVDDLPCRLNTCGAHACFPMRLKMKNGCLASRSLLGLLGSPCQAYRNLANIPPTLAADAVLCLREAVYKSLLRVPYSERCTCDCTFMRPAPSCFKKFRSSLLECLRLRLRQRCVACYFQSYAIRKVTIHAQSISGKGEILPEAREKEWSLVVACTIVYLYTLKLRSALA